VLSILREFGISSRTIGHFVLDNASNNNTTIHAIAQKLSFNAAYCRLRCGPHTLNLIGQKLLWGKNAEAYNNDSAELANEAEFMQEWRRDSLLGTLLSVITFIKTPQQYALFESFQRLAHRELLVKQRKVLKPVKPVITR
jgi:hypothetical protein